MQIDAPKQVRAALQRLANSGFEAFAVGGCVRDSLLGLVPGDWDITTAALPKEVEAVFADCRLIETGLRHGTVTVLLDGMPLEITTYRVDGDYKDARHPQSVTFSRNLREDLLRRDFTVNTLCWNEQRGVVDLFDGIKDLQAGTLRAVGEPEQRFSEDALRILRGVRFASTLGFAVAPDTAEAMLATRALLGRIAAERIREEFTKLICGKAAGAAIDRFAPVLEVFLPELSALIGCQQNTPYHCYDVFHHTLAALDAAPQEETLRLCMFFHDFGKPACRRVDANGVAHFKGHAIVSARLTEQILRRMRYPNKTVRRVTHLVEIHDTKAPLDRVQARKLLARLGEEDYRALIEIKRADCRAKAQPHAIDRKLEDMERFLREILKDGDCVSLHTLAVNGDDLLAAGVPAGSTLRAALEGLLNAVMEGRCSNEKGALLSYWTENAL